MSNDSINFGKVLANNRRALLLRRKADAAKLAQLHKFAPLMLAALKVASSAFAELSGQTDQNVVDVLNDAEKEVNFAIEAAEGPQS